MELKSAYELASERVIASKVKKRKEPEMDDFFVPLDDLKYPEDIQKEKELSDIKVVSYEKRTFSENMKSLIEVCWSGNFLDYGGFARMNRAMAFGLSDRNVVVKTEIADYLEHVNEPTKNLLNKMSNNKISEKAPKIYGATIPIDFPHNGKRIYYTMMETANKVHPEYADKVSMAHEIWVPTEYNKRTLINSGVKNHIMVMPLGVDCNRYVDGLEPLKIRNKLKGFVFLSVFRWGFRKGFDILLRAFMEEFSSDEDVSLLVASRPVNKMEEVGNNDIVDDFNTIKGMVDKDEEDMPHIALYTKPIPEKDMPSLYNSGDAFVLISRGEGMGLPYLEAGSCGLPVIASHCSGHSDFLTKDTAFLVEPEGYVSHKRTDPPFGNMARSCRFYEEQEFPYFGRESIEETKEHMRFVYENYSEEPYDQVKNLRKLIERNYTWDKAVDRVYYRLKEINEEGE